MVSCPPDHLSLLLPTCTRNDTSTSQDNDDQDTKYCYCQKGQYGDMVGCDNPSCPWEWFHFECLQLKAAPKMELVQNVVN